MEEQSNSQINNFKKSDKFFFKANLIFIIVMAVYAVVICISAIIMMVYDNPVGGIISLATGAVTIVIAFVVFKLFMSMLADIKFIRNKLYDLESENDKIGESLDKK